MDPARPFVWFIHPLGAWVPVILADVWKTTPFVTLLLLAGLQNIDASLYEAASIDGAGPWQQFRHVTLPLLKPAILVVMIFRTLDAFRVFDRRCSWLTALLIRCCHSLSASSRKRHWRVPGTPSTGTNTRWRMRFARTKSRQSGAGCCPYMTAKRAATRNHEAGFGTLTTMSPP
jgi:hypothetical protein